VTYKVLTKFISSREWGCGAMPYAELGGLTVAQFGRALAPANLSARAAKAAGLMTSGICGPHSSTLSRLADRSAWLASKLEARTALLGSTLYHLTWKMQTTPQGQSLYVLRGSARRISETGFTGWATPVANGANGTPEAFLERKRRSIARGNKMGVALTDLGLQAQLAGWPTPTTPSGGQVPPPGTSATGRTPDGRKVQVTLKDVASLAGWPTPTVADVNMTYAKDPQKYARDRLERENACSNLAQTAQALANGPARLTASGEMRIGSLAGMEGGGQLNPAHSRWLMGLPPAWDDFAPSEMRSTRKPRKNS